MLRGVRAALQSTSSIVFDLTSWQLCVVNRNLAPLQTDCFEVEYKWISLAGEVVEEDKISLPETSKIDPMSFAVLDRNISWPTDCGEVCFLRTQLLHQDVDTAQPAWLWLTNPSLGTSPDLSALGRARRRQNGARVDIVGSDCTWLQNTLQVDVHLAVTATATEVLFYPTLSLHRRNGDQLLPMADDQETDVVWLPGEVKERTLVHPTRKKPFSSVVVKLKSWNAVSIDSPVISCRPVDDVVSSAAAR